LPRLVGRGKALEMLLTGATVDAAEALRLGLVNRVAPPGRALAIAEEVARRILDSGPIAVAYAKEAVAKGMDAPLDQGLRLEADLSIILQTTADREEGVRAFLEKRPPRFRGE
jgi:enoyl-CoA hydratase